MNVLGIETSCDETSAAVVVDGRRLLSNVVSSQMEEHARYGGVVPELASRRHVEQIVPVIESALSEANVGWNDIDLIAVTNRPGLLGALLVGVSAAKAIAMARNLPIVGVHHIEAHLYANFLSAPESPEIFPAVALVVSGGHTDLFHVRGHGAYQLLGRTLDDAAGEAFDKGARLMGLGYPGGPAIQIAAVEGDPRAIAFPRAFLPGTHSFSFSGLKTALRYAIGGVPNSKTAPVAHEIRDLAASFQDAIVDVLVKKTVAAARETGVETVLLAGGVAANARLRERMADACERATLNLLFPPIALCTDNAAMIAAAGYFYARSGRLDALDFAARPSEPLARKV